MALPLPGFENEPDEGTGSDDGPPEPIVEAGGWRRVDDEVPVHHPAPAPSRLVRPDDRWAAAPPTEDPLPSPPDTPNVDPVFGDQSSTELGEVFVDRPWPTTGPAGHRDGRASRHPSPSRRQRSRRRKPARSMPAAPVAAGLAAVVAVVAGAVIYYTGLAAPPGDPEPQASADCAPPPTAPVVADVDGDGCTEEVRIADGVVQVGGERWALGGADDSVAVADWNCDGRATPALYQPATGHVFVFPGWADDTGPLEVAAAGRVPGGAGIVADTGDPCPPLVVEMPDGEHRPVGVTG